MKAILLPLVVALLFANSHISQGAAKLFFVKTYSEDFKKNSTSNFLGGDQIYGLMNVTFIAVNDNTVTTIDSFADANGNILITVRFPGIDKEVSWRVPLASGLVKKNRFLFPILPDKFTAVETHFAKLLKILIQNSGKKVVMNVSMGEKDVTASWQEDLTIDLTNGPGSYKDLYNLSAPAEVKNTNTLYPVCQSKTYIYIDYRRDEIIAKVMTPDSILFTANGTPHAAGKIKGYDLLRGGKNETTFFARVIDDQSFVIYQSSNGGFTYYHADKSKANEQDNLKRCPTEGLEKLKAEVKRLEDVEAIEYRKNEAEKVKKNKVTLTTYIRETKPRRADPALEKKISSWWNLRNEGFPVIKVIFLQSNYAMIRNEFDQVLRKEIGAIIVYHGKNGTCWAQFRGFGFEHLGGGAFNDELGAWVIGYNQYVNYSFDVSDMNVAAGQNYELDCNGLK